MLTILGKSSSINVRKVLWTCEVIGVPYQLMQFGAGTANALDSPDFLALNPHGMIPVLIDQDVVLNESNSICRYLAAQHQRWDLLPAQASARAQVEKWMDWQISDLNSAWRFAFMSLVRKSPLYQDMAMLEHSCTDWNRHMGVIDRHLSTQDDFLTGPDFTLADVVIGLSIHRWRSTPMTRPELLHVEAYFDRLRQVVGFSAHVENGYP